MQSVTLSALVIKPNKVSVENLSTLPNDKLSSNKDAGNISTDNHILNSSSNNSQLLPGDAATDLNKHINQRFSRRIGIEP